MNLSLWESCREEYQRVQRSREGKGEDMGNEARGNGRGTSCVAGAKRKVEGRAREGLKKGMVWGNSVKGARNWR